jgi:hypothetical protein
MADQKEPFVPRGDRPEVKINADAPIRDLTVRDLGAILGEHAILIAKRFKDLKHEKWEHPKIEKIEKWEHPKWEKHEKWEHPKIEKLEKWENIKREKLEKIEIDVFHKEPDSIPDPTTGLGPDPITQLVAAVSRLEEHVKSLDAQVQELRQKK